MGSDGSELQKVCALRGLLETCAAGIEPTAQNQRPGNTWQLTQRHDLRLMFDIPRYWTDRKYGKPSQRVKAQVDIGLAGLAEKLAAARKRVQAAQNSRLLPEESRLVR